MPQKFYNFFHGKLIIFIGFISGGTFMTINWDSVATNCVITICTVTIGLIGQYISNNYIKRKEDA